MASYAEFARFMDVPRAKRTYPTDPDREAAKAAWEQLEARGKGWKLHLNFDAQNPMKTSVIQDVLIQLQTEGRIAQFKIGHGGGKASSAPGKEATVYVGPRDKAEAAAYVIASQLGSILDAPEGDTLQDDMPIAGTESRIMGRFEVKGFDPDFHQYGRAGIPFLNRHMDIYNPTDPIQARAEAERILIERYGIYFTGTVPR